MNPFAQTIIGTVVRWLLTLIAGWLVTAGILNPSAQAEWIAGLSAALVTLVWGIYQKLAAKKLLEAAAPKG